MALTMQLWVITWNGLNSPIRRHWRVEWIRKQGIEQHICWYTKRLTSDVRHTQTESKDWKKMFHANGKQRKCE